MKKIVLIIMGFLILMMLLGCSAMRKGAVKLTDAHVANVEQAKEIATKLNDNWQVVSGFLKETLDYNKEDVDVESYDRMMSIITKRDVLAEEELSDENAGRIIALSVALIKELAEQAVKGTIGIVKSIAEIIPGV